MGQKRVIEGKMIEVVVELIERQKREEPKNTNT